MQRTPNRTRAGVLALVATAATLASLGSCSSPPPAPQAVAPAPSEAQDAGVTGEFRGDDPRRFPEAVSALPGLNSAQQAAYERGDRLFTEAQPGVGPIFNRNTCVECHEMGGTGGAGDEREMRMGVLADRSPSSLVDCTGFDPILRLGGPIKQLRAVPTSILEHLPSPQELAAAGYHGVLVTELRTTSQVRGDGLMSAVPDAAIRAQATWNAIHHPFGVGGHPNELSGSLGDLPLDGRVGKLGLKAQLPDNLAFLSDASEQELGLSSYHNPHQTRPNLPDLLVPPNQVELTEQEASDLDTFCSLMAPPSSSGAPHPAGAAAFAKAGCVACHVTTYRTTSDPGTLPPQLRQFFAQLGDQPVPCYSDLLVHHMGLGDAGGFPAGSAVGDEWRTAPLWGLRFKVHTANRYLHDQRAHGLWAAILAHRSPGSEANQVVANFLGEGPVEANNLGTDERNALLAFLSSL